MKRLLLLLTLTFASLTLAQPAIACPMCSEAVASAAKEETDADNTPAAFNQSIYVMVGVPYTAFCIVGFLIYRGLKKNAAYLASSQVAPETIC